jgi:hypothetical protein
MNYKNHTIFGDKKEKLNINKIFINKDSNNTWYFEKDKEKYNLSPSTIAELSYSPLIAGADRAIAFGCKQKNINFDNGIYLYFSTEMFFDCDISLELSDNLFGGWIYNAYSENIKVDNGQKIWACDYLRLYYKDPPNKIYLKIDKT